MIGGWAGLVLAISVAAATQQHAFAHKNGAISAYGIVADHRECQRLDVGHAEPRIGNERATDGCAQRAESALIGIHGSSRSK